MSQSMRAKNWMTRPNDHILLLKRTHLPTLYAEVAISRFQLLLQHPCIECLFIGARVYSSFKNSPACTRSSSAMSLSTPRRVCFQLIGKLHIHLSCFILGATINRIALTSSSSVSFLPFANSEKGDPNCGISSSSSSCTLIHQTWIAALCAITFVVPWCAEV